ncbi:MAG: hypothetical protein ABJE95_28480 [Byssovorax sp.]
MQLTMIANQRRGPMCAPARPRKIGRATWLLALIPALGCGTSDAIIRDDYPGSGGSSGTATASTATGPLCAGQCAPLGPAEWQGPALVWMGKPGEAPECPPSAPVAGDLGLADPSAPTLCGACACDSPHGSCALPTTWTAAAATCAGDTSGTAHTVFDAPAGWSGACTASNALPAGQKCNGVSCVQSLTIAPLALVEGACGVSSRAPPPTLPIAWGQAARSCHGVPQGECAGPSERCAPAVEPGYRRCLTRDGEHACPANYTEEHRFFAGLDDTRGCSPCGCNPPSGSTCAALVSAYADAACSLPVAAITLDATKPACVDILPAGAALGSKLGGEPQYAPGACAVSGGEPTGAAVPVNPITVCCLP